MVKENISEDEALILEKTLIKMYREVGEPLTNLTNGGEGISGYKHTKEALAKISAASSAKTYSEESKKKMSQSQMGSTHTPESKKIISQKQKEVCAKQGNQFLTGKSKGKHSKETKLKISNKQVKKYPILCVNNNTIYLCAQEAGKKLNLDHKTIWKVLNGKAKTYRGYTFVYVDRPDKQATL